MLALVRSLRYDVQRRSGYSKWASWTKAWDAYQHEYALEELVPLLHTFVGALRSGQIPPPREGYCGSVRALGD